MAKARRVRGVRPRAALAANAPLILRHRLDELLRYRPALAEPALLTDLHDMRIAAKRLRYAVEMFAVCYPTEKALLSELAMLQEQLGVIHDLDVLIEMLRARLRAFGPDEEMEAREVAAAGGSAEEQSTRLKAVLLARAQEPQRLGLLGLIGDKVVEREHRFREVSQQWTGGRLDMLAQAVRELGQPERDQGVPSTSEQSKEEP